MNSEFETLVNTLMKNNLAGSMNEARRMAEDMLGVSSKVNTSFENNEDHFMIKGYKNSNSTVMGSKSFEKEEPVQQSAVEQSSQQWQNPERRSRPAVETPISNLQQRPQQATSSEPRPPQAVNELSLDNPVIVNERKQELPEGQLAVGLPNTKEILSGNLDLDPTTSAPREPVQQPIQRVPEVHVEPTTSSNQKQTLNSLVEEKTMSPEEYSARSMGMNTGVQSSQLVQEKPQQPIQSVQPTAELSQPAVPVQQPVQQLAAQPVSDNLNSESRPSDNPNLDHGSSPSVEASVVSEPKSQTITISYSEPNVPGFSQTYHGPNLDDHSSSPVQQQQSVEQASPAVAQKEEIVEKTQEIKVEAKKERPKMPEDEVDLADVFNFNK